MIFSSTSHGIISCAHRATYYQLRYKIAQSSLRIPGIEYALFYRNCSSLPKKKQPETLTVYDKFGDIQHIYKFPFITYCGALVNLKWYAIPLLLLGAGIHFEDPSSDIFQDTDLLKWWAISFAAVLSQSYLIGLPFINFVAHIYISPVGDIVLSSLSFRGSRVDEKFPKGDLYLESREKGLLKYLTKDSYYMLLISRSKKKVFRINFKHCDMFDEELFIQHIGRIPDSAVA